MSVCICCRNRHRAARGAETTGQANAINFGRSILDVALIDHMVQAWLTSNRDMMMPSWRRYELNPERGRGSVARAAPRVRLPPHGLDLRGPQFFLRVKSSGLVGVTGAARPVPLTKPTTNAIPAKTFDFQSQPRRPPSQPETSHGIVVAGAEPRTGNDPESLGIFRPCRRHSAVR